MLFEYPKEIKSMDALNIKITQRKVNSQANTQLIIAQLAHDNK